MALRVYDKLKHAVRYWLLRRSPACAEIVQSISQSMDQRMSARERLTIRVHLWICAWCQWYLEHLLLIRETARANDFAASDLPGLSDEARERIRQKLTSSH